MRFTALSLFFLICCCGSLGKSFLDFPVSSTLAASDEKPEILAADIAQNVDWLGSTRNCGEPSGGPFGGPANKVMPYKFTCLAEAVSESRCYLGGPLAPFTRCISRRNRSANELVAWAVRDGLRGNRWRAVAWLALGQSHNEAAMKEINDNKRIAFDYVMAHYIAAWKHVNPDINGGNGQALREGQEGCGDSIKDCVGDDKISEIQIPAGLALAACKDEDCDGHHGHQCHTFYGPGTWSGNGAIGPHGGGLGFLHDEISYLRAFRP